MTTIERTMAAVVLICASWCHAADVDVSTVYELSSSGTERATTEGARGRVVIDLRTKGSAYVSADAPLRLELSGTGVQLDKTKLTFADGVRQLDGGSASDEKHADLRFAVGYTAGKAGERSVQARATFFICTEKLCVRQSRTLEIPLGK